MVWLVWAHAAALFAFGLVLGFPFLHMVVEAGFIAVAAGWATSTRGGRTFRTLSACFGLITSSAVLTHLSGGYIEMHFHFFVMLAVIAVYQQWIPFILSIGYVVVHHAVFGAIDPDSVFNHPDAIRHPLKWAIIHAGFISFASAMYVVHWRWNEVASDQAKQVLRSAGDGIIGLDAAGRVSFMNPASEQITGLTAERLFGRSLGDALGVTDDDWLDLAPGETREISIATGDGKSVPVEYTSTPTRDGDSLGGGVVTLKDITRRKQSQKALQDSEARYRTLFSRNQAGVYRTTVDGQVLDCNEALSRMMGYDSPDELTTSGVDHHYAEARDRGAFLDRLRETGTLTNHEDRLLRRDGEPIWVLESAILLPDESGDLTLIEGTMIDITERKRAEDTVKFLAYHDALTSLPNRALLEDRLEMTLAHARRSDQTLAVVFLDLDQFKLVNDTLGHSTGDVLLTQVAERLRRIVRPGDTIARVGGDEFVVVLADVGTIDSAVAVIERIRDSLRQPCVVGDQELRVTASLGVSVFPADGDVAGDLLRNADTAMYRAKEDGRDNCQLYTQGMGEEVLRRLTIQNDLRRAVDMKEFVVHYQPIINLTTGRISGCEALVRWQHPTRGLVQPDDFIPLAEDTGLIVPLGDHVVRTACVQLKAWQAAGLMPASVAINLSSHRLQYVNIEATIRDVLQETGLDPANLQIEITESVLMGNTEHVVRVLQNLRVMGIRISIDDFGTGYSSLSYLRRLPIDSLKVDRSFVAGIPAERDDVEIVSAIVALAHKLNLHVIAEGVETEEQASFLAEQGCQEAQGYLFGRPVPAEEFEQILASGLPLRATTVTT